MAANSRPRISERFGRRPSRVLALQDAPPRLLDYEGAQVIFIGAREDPEAAYHIDLRPEKESETSADIFRQLRLAKSRHPVEPLLRGEWR